MTLYDYDAYILNKVPNLAEMGEIELKVGAKAEGAASSLVVLK